MHHNIVRKEGDKFILTEEILNITGSVSFEECQCLFSLAYQVSDGCIIEIGSSQGRSTIALAIGSYLCNKIPLYAVEPHIEFIGILGGKFGIKDKIGFYKNMLNYEVLEIVNLLNTKSEIIGKCWEEEISLLWIDGDHSYDSVKKDFYIWEKKLIKGGLVAFHDSLDEKLGPYKVIKEILLNNRYSKCEIINRITILKKIL
ncbi:class I SAM-dependent methyltransferase [Candidatus Dependentiae bacterium]|nr:class I SAM-dependent methyltransferase [Candidatus Dependentiae bacterium]